MNWLLDENLSPRLGERLSGLFTGIMHVRDIGLEEVLDREIWVWAKAQGSIIFTADKDFADLSRELGHPPKIIHISQCDVSTREIEDCIRSNAIRITEFQNNPHQGLLVLRPKGSRRH